MKNLSRIVLLFLCIGSLSACNRGVGCPSDFSWNSEWLDAFVRVLEVLPIL